MMAASTPPVEAAPSAAAAAAQAPPAAAAAAAAGGSGSADVVGTRPPGPPPPGSNAVPADPTLLALPSKAPPEGRVLLAQKHSPVHELPPAQWAGLPMCRTRGRVCVAGMKRKLEEGGPALWADETAAQSNVALTRPSHDAWGIKKIVFVYCDDFLRRSFEMPWLHDPEWRALLLPAFEALGVPVGKVVRCLLAAMPPGISIPPHHDTGYWVHYTHRIHLPVVTDPSRVAFRVGPTVAGLERYDLAEGCLVELNNQAKHSVDNCWDRHRVHLIFDYIEDYTLERLRLEPGTQLHQTRRSIDLATEKGRRPCPSYLILGAQKSGTTSMYEYLTQHPLVLRAKRRETHYLDWRWRKDLRDDDVDGHRATYHKFFYKALLDENPSCLSGESTPSYLLHSDLVLPRVVALAPQAKLVVMLRDPVARAYSQYRMVVDPEGTPEQKVARGSHWVGRTFEEVVEAELAELAAHGVTPATTYDDFRRGFLASRPMGHGSHSLLARGLYALQLEPWLAAFPRDEQLLILFMDDMKTPEGAHRQVARVFDFLGLPPHTIIDADAKNTRAYPPIDPQTKAKLARFYAPFNAQLFRLLGREMPGWAAPPPPDAEREEEREREG